MKDSGAKNREPRSRRFSFNAVPEVSHLLLDELKRRKSLGLPNPTLNAIMNEWLLEHATKHLGRQSSGDA